MAAITKSGAESFAIGELARRTGVNIETIRYYERIDLMPAPPRTASGRRRYDESHARILRFIRRARELGFAIADIRTLLDLAEPADTCCAEVRKIAGAHLETVRAKLADLVKLERVLSETVAQCKRAETPTCPVLDILTAPSQPGLPTSD